NNSSQNMDFSELSKDEKSQLKHKITSSIYSYIIKRRRVKYALGITAAAVVILFSISVFNTTKQESAIEKFAKTQKNQSLDNHVNLILSDSKTVEIAEDNSTIAYSNSGQQVTIGTSKSVSQEASKKNDVVFNTLIVPYGKRSEIVLADGSKVWLNSGSKLIFPATFIDDKREVYLEGEAIFEVTHNKKQPFIVQSDNQSIKVLGTIFNVSNYADDDAIYTVLKSGSIQLSYKSTAFLHSTEHVKITPNTLATYNKANGNVKTNTVEVEKYFSWRDGIFIFKNDALKSIMKKIARYYNVEVVINDETLANQKFSGYLDVKENIEHVMQTIKNAETSSFEYHITDTNKLIINLKKPDHLK
ncbi:MAG: FecR domain-containing protein, partial [Gelidibacter sp.]|nr:FecR domain-containing protein [Gelidibacter sp.]